MRLKITGTLLLLIFTATFSLAQVGPMRLQVAPVNAPIPIGSTQQLSVSVAGFNGGSAKNVSSNVRWISTNPGIVTVNNAGLATSVARGTAAVYAISGPAVALINLTVVPTAPLTGLALTPKSPPPAVPKGLAEQFTATGDYSGTPQDVSALATWTSSNGAVAPVNQMGLAQSLATGSTDITATLGAFSDTATLTVGPVALISVQVTPATSFMPVGGTRQFTATGVNSDSTTIDATPSAVWNSTNSAAATISTGGLVTGTGHGTTTIQASYGGLMGATDLGVISYGAAVRLLEQSTFGPTPALVTQLQNTGFDAFLEQQFNTPSSVYPAPTDTLISTQQNFFLNNALNKPDQLRQRVAFALEQIMVISANKVTNTSGIVLWQNMMQNDAFGNYSTLLKDTTLSPAMGKFLDMVNNDKPDPILGDHVNENYAREILQLFSIGVYKLNPDGTQMLDMASQPINTYDQSVVEGYAHVFTGWTYPTRPGRTPQMHNPEFYGGPMYLFASNHDMGPKQLLDGNTLPGNQAGDVELDAALGVIFNHPNVGPFIGRRLIEHLVKSDPSPQYIARITDVFNDNGQGVRGDLRAVVKAILLDPEARAADTNPPAALDGHLREPVLYMTGVLRALNATSDGSALVAPGTNVGQNILIPPTVFNYYSPDYIIPNTSLYGPEFDLQDTATAFVRANFINTVVYGTLTNTTIDYSGWTALAANPDNLIESLNQLFLHGAMSPEMRGSIKTAVMAVPAGSSQNRQRAQAAIYLVATSSQYQVEH